MATLTGGCLCGAVRYEIAGLLRHITHCHCSMCRKGHGAAFATYATLSRRRFRLTAGESEIRAYRSSPNVTREGCRVCGSPLFWCRSDHPDVLEVALGSIDGDPVGRPEAHIFVASKACWFEITDALPRFDEVPS